MHYLCRRNKGIVPASLTTICTMFYNIYFTPSAIETVNKALQPEGWQKATSLCRKFDEATRVQKVSPGAVIRLSSEELVQLKSCIMEWYLHSFEDNRAMQALQVYKTIIEDIAEAIWNDEDVEIS